MHSSITDAPLDITIIGSSITSAWGNSHATTFRSLVKALTARGHSVTFYERDQPRNAAHRDVPEPPWGRTVIYDSIESLQNAFPYGVTADVVILGSSVPEAMRLGEWLQETAHGIVAFYDLDTPTTVAALTQEQCDYLTPLLVPGFDLYLTCAGGPVLQRLQRDFGAPLVRPLYAGVDPDAYTPDERTTPRYTLGYVGTQRAERQSTVEALLVEPARRLPDVSFVVAGTPTSPSAMWPPNVQQVEQQPPLGQCQFYATQQWTLNVTRAGRVTDGWSPGVRLFEAAACATPVISDGWDGLEHFFTPDREILIAHETDDVLRILRDTSERARQGIANRARRRVLGAHTAYHRALELEGYVAEARAFRAHRRDVALRR